MQLLLTVIISQKKYITIKKKFHTFQAIINRGETTYSCATQWYTLVSFTIHFHTLLFNIQILDASLNRKMILNSCTSDTILFLWPKKGTEANSKYDHIDPTVTYEYCFTTIYQHQCSVYKGWTLFFPQVEIALQILQIF